MTIWDQVGALPTDVDDSYEDDPTDPGQKDHQQHHDVIHEALQAVDQRIAYATDGLAPLSGADFTGSVSTPRVDSGPAAVSPLSPITSEDSHGARVDGANGTLSAARVGNVPLYVNRTNFSGAGTLINLRRNGVGVNNLGLSAGNALTVSGGLDVSGTKSALVVDPDDSDLGYRYGADESNTPGRITHPFDVEVDGGTAVVEVPEHLARIASDLRVRGPWAQGHPGSAYAGIDGGTLTVTGDDGHYLVEVIGVRSDLDYLSWRHVANLREDDAAPVENDDTDEG